MQIQKNILLFCLIGLCVYSSEKGTSLRAQNSDKRIVKTKREPLESEKSENTSDCLHHTKSEIDRVELHGSIATVYYRNGSIQIMDTSQDK